MNRYRAWFAPGMYITADADTAGEAYKAIVERLDKIEGLSTVFELGGETIYFENFSLSEYEDFKLPLESLELMEVL